MALIIEDGTGKSDATAFATVIEADRYLSARDFKNWPVTTSDVEPDEHIVQKEAALIRATDYMNTLDWRGGKAQWDQSLCWPRAGITVDDNTIPDNIVPIQVKNACIELAAVFFGGDNPLAPVERGGRIASETVASISTSYFDDAPSGTSYPAVFGIIAQFLRRVPNMPEQDKYTVMKVS